MFDSVSYPASFQACNPPFKTRTSLTPAHLSAQFTRKAADASLEYNMIVLSLVIPCFNKFFLISSAERRFQTGPSSIQSVLK